MKFLFEDRPSDSPFVTNIWRSRSEQADTFTSLAVSHWEMVVTQYQGRLTLTVRGPETIATPAPIPEDAEFFGIQFRLGTFILPLPVSRLVDAPVELPEATGKSFRLLGGGVIGDMAALPRSQLAVLPGTTHLTIMNRAAWLLSTINAFLDAPVS